MPVMQRIRNFFKQRIDRLRKWRDSRSKKKQQQQQKGDAKIGSYYNAGGSTQQSSGAGVQAAQVQTPLLHKDTVAAAGSTLSVELVNNTSSTEVFVYIIGLALNNNSAWFLLQSDGSTPYYPTSPSSTGSPLEADCAIQLGAPGSARTVSIPELSGGRIFVSIGSTLTFLLNPGPALVEPSVTNPRDPNINISWDFAEFTYSGSLYANITYVDFVGIPIALSLRNSYGATQTVSGMPSNGLDTICSDLKAQSNTDGVAGWSNLIVTQNGANLRALSPNSSLGLHPADFSNYFESYVDQVWARYTNSALTVKTADNALDTTGQVSASSNQLTLSNVGFAKPSTADIFSCNTGPFATGSDSTRNVLIPQLSAAFNRTTLLETSTTPAPAADFYQNGVTNHYGRIVHAANIDGRGYAFPYDDVNSAEGNDQSGFVNDPNPALLTVTFGGL
jgi:hypothetical protein